MRYQALKNGVPAAVAGDPDEAERLYAEYEADEIREAKSPRARGIIQAQERKTS